MIREGTCHWKQGISKFAYNDKPSVARNSNITTLMAFKKYAYMHDIIVLYEPLVRILIFKLK